MKTLPSPRTSLGIGLNVLASMAFAALYAYTSLLTELKGEEIFGWRMVFTVPAMLCFIMFSGYWQEVIVIFKRLFTERHFWLLRILSGSLLGFQLFLFMWAPVNGYGLDVSIGYFLLPLTMVAVGRLLFKDAMSIWQWAACIIATFGVGYQLVTSDSVSWPTLAVCIGYPGYFALRRLTQTNNMGGMWFDMSISLPISVFFIANGQWASQSTTMPATLIWLIVGLGVISTVALVLQTLSAPHLNLTLFGLLIYVEPVFLVLVSLMLGETLSTKDIPLYACIILAVALLVAEGLVHLRFRSATHE